MKALKPLEAQLHKAYYSNYKNVSTTEQNNLVADMYEAASGRKLQRNWGCSHCIMEAWRRCGEIYFQTLEEQKRRKKNAKESENGGSSL